MNNKTRIASVGASVAAVAVIVAGAWGIGSNIAAQPEPTPTETITEIVGAYTGIDGATVQESDDLIEASDRIEAERAAAAAAEAERIAAEQAAAQAAADEAARETERASQQTPSTDGGGTNTPAQPPAPIRCPAGSVANSNDGVNDTSCFPEICFSIVVPNPEHPECDVAFRP